MAKVKATKAKSIAIKISQQLKRELSESSGTLQTKDAAVSVARGSLLLSHDLISKDLCMLGTYSSPRTKVLIRKADRNSRTAYYQVHRDPVKDLSEGWYIKRRERGVFRKRYLHSCEVTIINGVDALYEYRLKQ